MEQKEDKLNLVVFRILNDDFGVEVHSTREILKLESIAAVPQSPEFIEGIINVRGHAVAVIDLRKRFGIKDPGVTEKTRIMIVRSSRMIVGLIVDAVMGVRSFDASRIQPTPAIVSTQVDHRFISGVSRLDDRMIFLVNLDEILTSKNTEFLRAVVTSAEPKQETVSGGDPSAQVQQK